MSLRTLLLGACLVLGSPCALAVCATSTAAVSLGSANSLTLQTTQSQAGASSGLTCPGLLNLLAAAYARVTLIAGTLQLQNGGYQIPLHIYADPGYSMELQSNIPVVLSGLTLLSIGGTGAGVPLYFRTELGANVPAGTYTASVSLRWQWAICTSGVLNACVWDRSTGVSQNCPLGLCQAPTWSAGGSDATVNLTLNVTKACLIDSTPNLSFNTSALISQFTAVTQSVTVTCTNTEGYLVGFDVGEHFQSTWRQMSSGSNFIRYHLYHPGNSTVWDNTGNVLTTNGTGLQQLIPYKAVIDPSQPNVPAGTYKDNVTLEITY